MSEKIPAEEKGFDPGKKYMIEFGKGMIISQQEVRKRVWSKDKEEFVPAVHEDGSPKMVTETRVRLPRESEYKGFVLTTQENVFAPHRFDKDGLDKGPSEKMLGVKLYENASYKITKTPYLLDEQGNPVKDDNDKKLLDFENQQVVRLTGKELQEQMNAWRKPQQEQKPEQSYKRQQEEQPAQQQAPEAVPAQMQDVEVER